MWEATSQLETGASKAHRPPWRWAAAAKLREGGALASSLPDSECLALKRQRPWRQGLCVPQSPPLRTTSPTPRPRVDGCLSACSHGSSYPCPLPKFGAPGRPRRQLQFWILRLRYCSRSSLLFCGESSKSTFTSMPPCPVGRCCGE